MTLLSTEKLTKLYAPDTGAQSINIELNKGEIVGFIGPNGAGKSTTMEMIMHLIAHDSGRISVFGKDIESRDNFIEHLEKIGYMPAEGGLYGFLKVRELVDHCGSFYKRYNRKKVFELVDEIKLDPEKTISQLSSGNKKKLSFIISIVNDPEILILDEPTSSLDPLVQKQLLDKISDMRSEGKAILLSSHTLSEVQSVCDRVYLIKDSRIILSERTLKLLDNTQRKITVKNIQKSLLTKLIKMSGLNEIQKGENELSFYTNRTQKVIKVLVENKHYDFLIEQPTLEKMFMEYYK